jgi:hypothetical protein
VPPTTVPPTNSRCADLRNRRAQFNAQITAQEQRIIQQFGSQAAPVIAQLERSRAQGNAQIDRALATCATSPIPGPTATTTTTPVGPAAPCPDLRARRAQFNAQINAVEQQLSRSFSGAQLAAVVAQLEASRAQGNAQIDQQLAACPPGA